MACVIARVVVPVSVLLLLALQAGSFPALQAGTLQQQLVAADGTASDQFGSSVDVDGDTLIVGAPRDDIGSNVDQGSAYVFVRSGGVWTQQAQLTGSTSAAGDQFGFSVAVSGDTAIVGAPFQDLAFTATGAGLCTFPPPFPTFMAASNTGFAYVFVRSGGVWTEQQRLSACQDPFTMTGFSVAIDGDTAVVGAPGCCWTVINDPAFRGKAFIYKRTGVSWQVENSPGFSGDQDFNRFGASVAIDGNTVFAGASSAGFARAFVRSGSTWSQQANLPGSGGIVALNGDTAAHHRQYSHGLERHACVHSERRVVESADRALHALQREPRARG